MPRLRLIEASPATCHHGHDRRPDPDIAAFLGSSREVCELYSSELPAANVTARASSIRVLLEDATRPAGFGVTVFTGFYGGYDFARLAVPVGFAQLPAAARAHAALDAIHETVTALAGLRGWDRRSLDGVRERVERRGLRFDWASRWKSAPDRRHQARAVYWLDGEGNGHVQLEIRRTADTDDEVVARGEPALAFMTVQGFKRSAATLRWTDTRTVTAVPWADPFRNEGHVHLHVDDTPLPSGVPEPWPAHDAATEISIRVLTGDERNDDPDQPWILLQGQAAGGSGAYGTEIARVTRILAADPDFAAWWAGIPFGQLCVFVTAVGPDRGYAPPRPGARKYGEDLRLQLVTPLAELPPKSEVEARQQRARDDLHAALTQLAASRKLPPPPPMPARVSMNARQWRAQGRP